jgi:hypothetical protein
MSSNDFTLGSLLRNILTKLCQVTCILQACFPAKHIPQHFGHTLFIFYDFGKHFGIVLPYVAAPKQA